jgi:hypothetical protein
LSLLDVDPLGKGKIKEKEKVPFDMACSTLFLPKKSQNQPNKPQNQPNSQSRGSMDVSMHSVSSSHTATNSVNGSNNANRNNGSNNNLSNMNNKKQNQNGSSIRGDNQVSKDNRIKNNQNDNHNNTHEGMEGAFDKVSNVFGNLDSKIKGAAAKLDPNYKQKEANAAAEREQIEADSRAQLEKEKRIAAEKWEANLKRVKEEKRAQAEEEAERDSVDQLIRILKLGDEEDESQAAAEEVCH